MSIEKQSQIQEQDQLGFFVDRPDKGIFPMQRSNLQPNSQADELPVAPPPRPGS